MRRRKSRKKKRPGGVDVSEEMGLGKAGSGMRSNGKDGNVPQPCISAVFVCEEYSVREYGECVGGLRRLTLCCARAVVDALDDGIVWRLVQCSPSDVHHMLESSRRLCNCVNAIELYRAVVGSAEH
jgi:hypothetical protein